MTTLAALGSVALAHAGMTGLALAMERHHRQLRPAAPRPGRLAVAVWRVAGWTVLALSLWLGLAAWSAATGAAVWCGVLSAVTLVLILSLPYAPALAWRLGWITGAFGLLSMLGTLAAWGP